MKVTDETEVTSEYIDPTTAGYTEVFSGSVTWEGSGWKLISFDTPFEYNGTSNLQISWENRAGSYSSAYPHFYISDTGINSSVLEYLDANFPLTDGTVNTFIPNTRLNFSIEGEPTVAELTSPLNQVIDVEQSAELTWVNGDNTTGVDVYLSTSLDEVANSVESAKIVDNQNIQSFTPNLNLGAQYFWKVVSRNNEINYEVASTVWSFITAVGLVELPSTEGFENCVGPNLPIGWTSLVQSTSTYAYVKVYDYNVFEGEQILMMTNSNDLSGVLIAASPLMDHAGARVKFYARGNSDDNYAIVGYMTDVSDASTFVEIETLSLTEEYAQYEVALEPSRTERYFAVKHGHSEEYNSLYFDNFLFEAIPENEPDVATLLAPSNNEIDVVMTSSLSWETGANTANVDVYFSSVFSDVDENVESAKVIDAGNSTTYQLTGLDNFTNYFWKVVTVNDAGVEVDSPVYSFLTEVQEGSVRIGTGEETGNALPMNPYFRYSYSQSIYTFEQINETGAIETLAWEFNGNSAFTDTVTVYMAMVDSSAYLTGSSWIPVDDLTEVYSGTLETVAARSWSYINLDNSFAYDGSSNLVIALVENGHSIHGSADRFYSTATELNRSLSHKSDSINPDVTTPPNGITNAFQSNVYLGFGEAIVVIVAPTDLTAEVQNENDVVLTWVAPVTEEVVTGYNVLRDDVVIATVTELTYTDAELANGSYNYSVTATYSAGTSEASNSVSVTIDVTEEDYYAPSNLTADIDENDVTLTWGAPIDLAEGSWLTKGAEDNNDGIGTGDAADIRVAHRYTQEELVAYQGLFINTIKMFPREAAATYTLKVWGGDDGLTELYSQAIDDFLVEAWNEYDLAASVAIPTEGDLYVGYFVSTTTGYPCGSDAGPHVDGGDMIMFSSEAAWGELHVLAASLDYNWNIQAFVSDQSGTRIANNSTPMISKSSKNVTSIELKAGDLSPVVTSNTRVITRDLTGYNVYRDGVEIASVGSDVLTYSDEDLENGDYDYHVTAIYNEEGESISSNVVSVVISVIPENDLLFADSFESYNDFALAFGEWTCVDVDLTPSFTITDTEFIHGGEAFAYIVFTPESTVPPLSDAYAAHTGDKYLAAFGADPSQGNTNNDWLISQAFTLSDEGSFNFWAKSITDQYGAERFNVSTNPNDFTAISGDTYIEAPTSWTQYSYDLDAYADQTIRVAVQCVSNDAFIFMLDDVEVIAPNATPNNDNDVTIVTALGGNYPNPFNPETTISYNMKNSGNVTIEVYNILGQKVKTLVNENKTAGNHTVVWNGSNENNDSVASGVYFYKMRSGKYSKTHKMILMK